MEGEIKGPTSPCCTDPANRITVFENKERQHQRCGKCGRNHYTAFVDPIKLFAKAADLGPPAPVINTQAGQAQATAAIPSMQPFPVIAPWPSPQDNAGAAPL